MTTTATTTTDPKIEAVHRLYDAYRRGDIEAVLAEGADNVDGAAEAAGDAVPWWGPHLGRTEVPQFFQEIASNVDITEFEVLSHLAGRDDVISTVHWTFTRQGDRQARRYVHAALVEVLRRQDHALPGLRRHRPDRPRLRALNPWPRTTAWAVPEASN